MKLALFIIGLLFVVVEAQLYVLHQPQYGTTQTASSDTLNTLRTNTNTAFANLGSSCNLLNADTSIAATSSGYVYCTGTPVASGDTVMDLLSTTTANQTFGGWWIVSANASSTAGNVDMRLYNGTGAAAVPSATRVGSSTQLWDISNT